MKCLDTEEARGSIPLAPTIDLPADQFVSFPKRSKILPRNRHQNVIFTLA